MKTWIVQLALLLTTVLVTGCGGHSIDQQQQPKGEGNIPIGCAKNCIEDGGHVVIYRSDGEKYETNLVNGDIFSPKLSEGLTRIEVYPANSRLSRQAITVEAGAEQTHIARMWPLPKNFTIVLQEIMTDLKDGQVLALGSTTPIGLHVRAFASAFYLPTVFVNGGIGSLDDQGNFIATQTGKGVIAIRVGNTVKAVNIEVR